MFFENNAPLNNYLCHVPATLEKKHNDKAHLPHPAECQTNSKTTRISSSSLSVCENVFEQQVSKFPFEMTQPAAAACWSWAATHSHPITPKTARGRCEGDGCVALVRPAG